VDRHDAFSRTLPHHAHGTVASVHVTEIEARELRDPDAACIEQFEDRTIAQTLRGREIRKREKLVEERFRGDVGQASWDLRGGENGGGTSR